MHVNTALLYGCTVWGCMLFPASGDVLGDYVKKFEANNHFALRAVLSIKREAWNSIFFVLLGELPLKHTIAKQMIWYVKSLG